MEKILDFVFVPALVVIIYRCIVHAYFGVAWTDWNALEGYVCIGAGIFAVLWFWHRFIRRRCSECHQTSPWEVGSKEIERFIGAKKVRGTDGKGRTTTSHVSVTFAKIQHNYKCRNKNCDNEWVEVSKREVC